ncbi:MAG TPA: carbohydrate ABC transporter permease, partial [Bacteroidales bacterium]|nr:carbohydrate ABC transporter permease [Bacteroidales bacterium]
TFFVLFTMLFSGGMVPTYLMNVRYLHLDNTIWIYILPGLVSAWNLIIIRTNYKSIPEELIEAAKIDGAGELYICFKIVMPICKPVLASVGFLFLVAKWNDWNTALLYITNPNLYSLQYLLQKILNEAEFLKQLAEAGQLVDGSVFPSESYRYAMALIAAGPVLLVFPFFQKYFAKGMTIGGVKG